MDSVNILIVDDEPNICKALERDLSENGYNAQSAQTAEEAIEKCKSTKFDIAFIDYVLPDMNGIELCAIIKQMSPETEMIFMTGYISDNIVDVEIKFAEAGGKNFYLYKPFHENEILGVVKKVLQEKE